MPVIDYLWLTAPLLLAMLFIAFRPPTIRKYRTKPKNSYHGYRLFYSDQKQTKRKSDVIYSRKLVSETYAISGKPDYIFKSRLGGSYMPVELKSGAIKDGVEPHEGDLMQLAAYFLIIEDLFGKRPRKGLLSYSDYTFEVRNNKRLRKHLMNTLEEMRTMLVTGEGEAEPGFAKCRHCLCRGTVCEFVD